MNAPLVGATRADIAPQSPRNAAATSTTALPLSVAVVDFDRPWLRVTCNVQVHDDCTYKQLADVVQIHLLCNEQHKAGDWPRVVNFFSFTSADAPTSTQPLQSSAPAIERQLRAFCFEPHVRNRTLPSPMMKLIPKLFFVREAYESLASELDKYAIANYNAFVITGTPGVGKTFFLWYLLWLYCSESPVVFDGAGVFLLVHPNGSTIRGEHGKSFRQFLANKNTKYLCDVADGRKPLMGFDICATTIVTKSPGQSVIKEFVKTAQPKVLYMPLWTIEELENCRAECFQSTAKNTIKILFSRFGGTARETLVRNEDLPSKLAEFKSIMNSLKDDEIQLNLDLIEMPGVVDTKQHDVCHRILHLRLLKDKDDKTLYDQAVLVPATTIVSRELVKRDAAARKQRIRRFITVTVDEPKFAATSGYFFEGVGHEDLAAGGQFKIRKLNGSDADREDTLTLPVTSKTLEFDEIVEVNNEKYAIPLSRNFPVIDALMKPNRLFQMTVSGSHPINHSKLKEILVKLLMPDTEDSAEPKGRSTKKRRIASAAKQQKSTAITNAPTADPGIRAVVEVAGAKKTPTTGSGKGRLKKPAEAQSIQGTKRQRSPSGSPPTQDTLLKKLAKDVEFYFVVPEHRFKTFKAQRFTNRSESEEPLPIQQYALCINLNDRQRANPEPSK